MIEELRDAGESDLGEAMRGSRAIACLATTTIVCLGAGCGSGSERTTTESEEAAAAAQACADYEASVEAAADATDEALTAAETGDLQAASSSATTLSVSFGEPIARADVLSLEDTIDVAGMTAAYHPYVGNTTYYPSLDLTSPALADMPLADALELFEAQILADLDATLEPTAGAEDLTPQSPDPTEPPDRPSVPGLVEEGGDGQLPASEAQTALADLSARDLDKVEDVRGRVTDGDIPVVRIQVTGYGTGLVDALASVGADIAFAATGGPDVEARLVDDPATVEALSACD